jgi:hypothetical protein
MNRRCINHGLMQNVHKQAKMQWLQDTNQRNADNLNNVWYEFDVVLTVHRRYYVEIKCQLDATDEFLLQILTCFGHLYAHHQEL